QLRTHPRWEIRRDALDDPSPLFATSALLMLLTGTIATLMNYQLMQYFEPHMAELSAWVEQGLAAVPAAVVTAAATVVLWRAVVRAAVLGRPAPTGVRAGLWLGLGLIAGSLINGESTGDLWLPSRWWALLLVIAAAVAFACWTTQCARLAAASWPARSLRWPLTLCLIAGWLILAAWFVWWDFYGVMYANGFWYAQAGMRLSITHWFPGVGTVHPDAIDVMAQVVPVLRYAAWQPLTPAATVTAWAMPLTLWAVGAKGRGRGWLRRSPDTVGQEGEPGEHAVPPWWLLPALRRTVVAALIGTVVATLGVAGVQAWLHSLHAGAGHRGGMYAFSYAIWSLWAIVAGTAAASAVAVASARFRLVAALVAAGISALLGLGAATVLMSADGCVQPLAVLDTSCGWRPAWNQLRAGNTFALVAHSALFMAPVTAAVVTALAVLVGCARRAIRAKGRVPEPLPVLPTSHTGTSARFARSVSAVLSAIGVPAAAFATAAVLIAGDAGTQLATQAQLTTAAAEANFRQTSGLPVLPVPASMRRQQVRAWYALGGRYLLSYGVNDTNSIVSLLRSATRDNREQVTAALMARIRPLCQGMWNIASWEPYYFQVPDPAAESSWHRYAVGAYQGGQDCLRAITNGNAEAFNRAMIELLDAGISIEATSNQVTMIINDPSDPLYKGQPVQPPQPRL
ncbi:hypothetical protein, partial [Kitasatospora acidiphila]|uniref:hypothetical protein n=1 Tax=Kitasatospora acidiphila TaxID=2567942 RepID=UPI003C772713